MKKLRVLVIDDSLADLELASRMLEAAGHHVIPARDGAQGIELARTQLPDLILMDVVMPRLNGFQATRQLCRDAQTSHIPVIVVSGKREETDRMWAMRQGARAYITKTLDRKTLLSEIDRVMSPGAGPSAA